MKSIKVRFNLGKGKNFMKWKIQYPDGKIEYHSPTDVELLMHECILKNHKSTAQKIFDGGEKVVCAWVLCKDLTIAWRSNFVQGDIKGQRVSYNPRVTPHWMLDGEIVDGSSIDKLVTVDRAIYKI